MLGSTMQAFRTANLYKKVLFTLCLLALCRLGSFIPVPGVDAELALAYFRSRLGFGQNVFQLMDVFSGGAFSQMTIAALGLVPYMFASNIMQVVSFLIPSLQKEIKENSEYGRRKLGQWTRLLTLLFAVLQSVALARHVLNINQAVPNVIYPYLLSVTIASVPWLFYLTLIVTMTTTSLLLMWVGEQITEQGIGNGMSLIITVNILSSFPSTIARMISELRLESQEGGELSIGVFLLLIFTFVVITLTVVQFSQAHRKIPIQYSQRQGAVHSSGVYRNESFFPMKLNFADVLPVIYANNFLMIPGIFAQFVNEEYLVGRMAAWITPGTWVHSSVYFLLILFSNYFFTAMRFNPQQIASDMKKNGAFIAGIRQGRATQDYLEGCMNKLTLMGGFLLASLAIVPGCMTYFIGVDQSISHFFGGTSLLIVVGVILETARQIESHRMMQRYEGFMRKGRVKPLKT